MGNYQRVEVELEGKSIILETGKMAGQANASVIVSAGESIVLVTAVMAEETKEDIDFFPLICDFEEKLYAAGKIPGGFIKREGRPSERAILTSRLIDRPIRPLFPEGMRREVQIVATPLSADLESPLDVLAVIGASAALSISDIPFEGPIGCVQVGRIQEKFILNPTSSQINESDLKLVIAGTEDAIIMVEAEAKEVSEEVIISAIEFAKPQIKKIIEMQKELHQKVGIPKKEIEIFKIHPEIENKVKDLSQDELKKFVQNPSTKRERDEFLRELEKKVLSQLKEEFPDKENEIRKALNTQLKEVVRRHILEKEVRLDGRKFKDIRPINCEIGLLPRAHGSGLFSRGETQVLTIATLGAVGEEQIIDGLGSEESKRFIHQYNFPPFSVGETRPMRGPGRREIGHGALAERSLGAVIPDQSVFPYTIRLVSEVLSSNGSTSMASVCGSTLALMDAGIPISAPVSGIAMGLIKEGERAVVISDIQGIEDAFGDMDFKVAGTKEGITALQMDIKIKGINIDIIREALLQAKEGRLLILEKMLEVISSPRSSLSPYAPHIFTIEVPTSKIGELIGPGGKTIKKIIEETGVKIDIEENGLVYVTTPDEKSGKKALQMIEDVTKEAKVGESYLGKVLRTTDFGAFVEILPGKEGLLHISHLSWERVNKVEDVVKVGDRVLVKVIGIDEMGRINLSRKALLPPPKERNLRPKGPYR